MTKKFQELLKLTEELMALGVTSKRLKLGYFLFQSDEFDVTLTEDGGRGNVQEVKVRLRVEHKARGEAGYLDPDDTLPPGWEEEWFTKILQNLIREGLRLNGAHQKYLEGCAHTHGITIHIL